MNTIWVIGQVTADQIFRGDDNLQSLRAARAEPEMRVGGKAFNIAAAIARLGLRVELISAVGTDRHGKVALANMKKANVGSKFVVQGDGRTRPISTPVTSLTEGIRGERAVSVDFDKRLSNFYEVSLERARAHLENGGPPPAALIYTLELPNALTFALAEVVRSARNVADVYILGNPAPRRVGVPTPSIGQLIRLSDVVIPNRYESAFLLGNDESNDVKGERLARRIRETYVIDAAICTLGAKGWAWSKRDGTEGAMRLPPVRVREKIGASDVFTGVYTALSLPSRSIEVACFAAGVAAREAVQRNGGYERFPSRASLVNALCRIDDPRALAASKLLKVDR